MAGDELNGGGAMAGQRELTGVPGFRSTVHNNTRRGHQEREREREGELTKAKNRGGTRPRTTRRTGWQTASTVALGFTATQ